MPTERDLHAREAVSAQQLAGAIAKRARVLPGVPDRGAALLSDELPSCDSGPS